ncbi:hypothetical protein IFM89_014371, partial [Coptis chinensis]
AKGGIMTKRHCAISCDSLQGRWFGKPQEKPEEELEEENKNWKEEHSKHWRWMRRRKNLIIDDFTMFGERLLCRYWQGMEAGVSSLWTSGNRKRNRGYYGPLGTGKSTMIAAIANFLEYDIYDIEEEEKETEDTKAKEENGYGSSKLTLSGLLNFIDGLWYACAEDCACGEWIPVLSFLRYWNPFFPLSVGESACDPIVDEEAILSSLPSTKSKKCLNRRSRDVGPQGAL